MFTLSFDTDNAVFEEHPEQEVSRILSEIAHQVLHNPVDHHFQNVRDINGNTIGTWKLVPEESR
jgi:hypothetical protein